MSAESEITLELSALARESAEQTHLMAHAVEQLGIIAKAFTPPEAEQSDPATPEGEKKRRAIIDAAIQIATEEEWAVAATELESQRGAKWGYRDA